MLQLEPPTSEQRSRRHGELFYGYVSLALFLCFTLLIGYTNYLW